MNEKLFNDKDIEEQHEAQEHVFMTISQIIFYILQIMHMNYSNNLFRCTENVKVK